MARSFNAWLVLLSLTTTVGLRAAAGPHAGSGSEANATWTNEDLERLGRISGLISVVGQPSESPRIVTAPAQQPAADPAWYAAMASELRAELESEQVDLLDFTQLVEDARERRNTIPRLNLEKADVGITPESTIDILQGRVRETQGEIDALEDLARRNGIEPGILRGQWPNPVVGTKGAALDQRPGNRPVHGGGL